MKHSIQVGGVEKNTVIVARTYGSQSPALENSVAEKIPVIDEVACISCGACEEICPEVFRMNKSLGFALVINPSGADSDKIEEAMEACPVNCIFWSED